MKPLTPKADFLKNKEHVKQHQDLVESPLLREVCTKVIAHYALNLPSASSPASSWNNACKLEGAKDALNLLLTFAEQAAPAKGPTNQPLNPV